MTTGTFQVGETVIGTTANGKELIRTNNLPIDAKFDTYATSGTPNERKYYEYQIPSSNFINSPEQPSIPKPFQGLLHRMGVLYRTEEGPQHEMRQRFSETICLSRFRLQKTKKVGRGVNGFLLMSQRSSSPPRLTDLLNRVINRSTIQLLGLVGQTDHFGHCPQTIRSICAVHKQLTACYPLRGTPHGLQTGYGIGGRDWRGCPRPRIV